MFEKFNKYFLIPQEGQKYNPSTTTDLFLFHYAAGGASIYFDWISGLNASIRPIVVQLPGRENRIQEDLFKDINELIEDLCNCYNELPKGKNQIFLGYSMGAVVSYYLALELQKKNIGIPEHLFLMAANVPNFESPIYTRRIADYSDFEFMEIIKEYKGTPEALLSNLELVNFLLPRIRADFQVLESCKNKEIKPLNVNSTLFCGKNDQIAPIQSMVDWKYYLNQDITFHLVNEGHFFLNESKTKIHRTIEKISQSLYEGNHES